MSRLYFPSSPFHAAIPMFGRAPDTTPRHKTAHTVIMPETRYEPSEAWVVFSGEADLWWLKILKPGFRHCFVVARDDNHWIVLDPLSPHLELAVLPLPHEFDVPNWLREQNLTVIQAPITRRYQKAAPVNLFSCVEVIKRFLGIHARRIVTPWQLYRFLNKEHYSYE